MLFPGHLASGEMHSTNHLLIALDTAAEDAEDFGAELSKKIFIDRGGHDKDRQLHDFFAKLSCGNLPLFNVGTLKDRKTDRLIIENSDAYKAAITSSIPTASILQESIGIWDALLWMARCLEIGTTYADRSSWEMKCHKTPSHVQHCLLYAYNLKWHEMSPERLKDAWRVLINYCEEECEGGLKPISILEAYKTVFGGLARTSWTQATGVSSPSGFHGQQKGTAVEAFQISIWQVDDPASAPSSYKSFKKRLKASTSQLKDPSSSSPHPGHAAHNDPPLLCGEAADFDKESFVVCDRLPLTLVVASCFTSKTLPEKFSDRFIVFIPYCPFELKDKPKESERYTQRGYQLQGVVIQRPDLTFECRYARTDQDGPQSRHELRYTSARDSSKPTSSFSSTEEDGNPNVDKVVLCFFEACEDIPPVRKGVL